ncbi:MAG: ATP-dependent Clp protease ATP-binding subunit [Clostridia bacterium]|nr:ATP-dependent Clp protease ATP-binding subunit [Clostridia bacterium]
MQNAYTPAASAVLSHTERTAVHYRHGYIGTEHLLYALLCGKTDGDAGETPCIAARILRSHGISQNAVRGALAALPAMPVSDTDSGTDKTELPPAMTPMLKRILDRAQREAERFPALPMLAENGQNDKAPDVPPLPMIGTPTRSVGTEHLLFALLCETDSAAAHLLAAQNVPLHELYGDVLSFLSAVAAESDILGRDIMPGGTRMNPAIPDTDGTIRYTERSSSGGHAGAGQDGKSSGSGSAVSVMRFLRPMETDVTVIGREAETEQVMRILLQKHKNNPCLLGDAGTGKTAIVEGVAQKLARGEVPAGLRGKRILSLDLSALLAGTRYRGDFEERLCAVVDWCSAHPEIILFLDEIHMLMGAGAAEGAADAANLLKPALARGTLHLIGATTHKEYRRTIASDEALARRFRIVTVDEPDEETAIAMLSGLRGEMEVHHHVTLPGETLTAAVRYAVRYLPDRRLPDKALDLLDDACAAVSLAAQKNVDAASASHPDFRNQAVLWERDRAILSGDLAGAEKMMSGGRRMSGIRHKERDSDGKPASPLTPPVVLPADIAGAVTQRTGIPIPTGNLISEKTGPMHLCANELAAQLSRSVIGQDNAISRIAAAYTRMTAGLARADRPAASFLFWGPSGVGKTALCRALAACIYGGEEHLLRFDMSEYMERHAVSTLIGAPPGYVGYETRGTLTEAVRKKPFSLLLFDEAEKAHPEILYLFLQMLDAGRLTDGHGERVDFTNTVIIMTTNAGADTAHRRVGFVQDTTGNNLSPSFTPADPIPDALLRAFPPEFLNRFDAVIPFAPLTEQAISEIVQNRLDALIRRAAENGMSLRITAAVKKYLSKAAFAQSALMGARPVVRLIADHIEAPLADALAAGAGTFVVRMENNIPKVQREGISKTPSCNSPDSVV